MKERYVSPEAEVVCFAPVERLAYLETPSWMTWGVRSTADDPTGSTVEVPDTTADPVS